MGSSFNRVQKDDDARIAMMREGYGFFFFMAKFWWI